MMDGVDFTSTSGHPNTMSEPAAAQIDAFTSKWPNSGGHERAAEEERGLIPWLRPDYQSHAKACAGRNRPWSRRSLFPED
jgi:hypothetical protein